MRSLRYTLLDVFTTRALTGNSLAVFTDARGLSPDTLQALAREMNLSESVFVLPPEAGGQAKIRIFTTAQELPFAGHPTLGAAFALGGALQAETVRLETGVGIIPVRLERDGAKVVFGWMEQRLPIARLLEQPAQLLAALGLSDSALPVVEYDNSIKQIFVATDSEQRVATLRPNLEQLGVLFPDAAINVFCVQRQREAETLHVKTRNFAVAFGMREDPATGSAAGSLAVHLHRHGQLAFGTTLHIHQGEEIQRPSELFALLYGSADTLERVEVGGSAIVIGRGEIGHY